jgi:hypothetical protein
MLLQFMLEFEIIAGLGLVFVMLAAIRLVPRQLFITQLVEFQFKQPQDIHLHQLNLLLHMI